MGWVGIGSTLCFLGKLLVPQHHDVCGTRGRGEFGEGAVLISFTSLIPKLCSFYSFWDQSVFKRQLLCSRRL